MRSRNPLSSSGFLRRNSGYIFLFCVLFIFMQVGFHSGRRHHAQLEEVLVDQNLHSNTILSFIGNGKSVIQEHPIPRLMLEADTKYKAKLGRQSKTLKAAVTEYRRRYDRAPPKGFDAWWNFAQKHKVKMIDEYDSLMDDLKPFWGLPGEELRRRSTQVGHLPSIDLVRIRNGSARLDINPDFNDTEVSARARGFSSMIKDFVETVCLSYFFISYY